MSSVAKRNIGGDPNDPSYRYKMPHLLTKVEGRGNGIKTRLDNIVDVAKALKRPPSYPTKYFGCELGALSQYEEKTGCALVNGEHDNKTINLLLDNFIKVFVLCPQCKLPESDLSVKRNDIWSDCSACGHYGMLKTTHKVTAHILKNPPKKKNRIHQTTQEAQEKEEEVIDFGNDDIELDDSTIEWSADTSVEAAEARRENELGARLQTLTLTADDSVINELKDIVEGSGSAALKFKSIRKLQRKHGFGNEKRIQYLFKVCYGDGDNCLKKIDTYAPIITQALKHPRSQGALLGTLEEHLLSNKSLLPQVNNIFMGFYDKDILSEELFLDWARVETTPFVSAKEHAIVVKASSQFIEWLQEDDDDDEDDDEEE